MTEDIELTEEETERVNKIITGIQSDLNNVLDILNSPNPNYDKALRFLESGINKSNCPLCKRELSILMADITHNKQICILNADTCESETKEIITKTVDLKDDFVPIKTKKKAIKEKIKALEEMKFQEKPKVSQPTFVLPPPFQFLIPR